MKTVDQSEASVWNRGIGAAVDQPPVRSASFPFTLISGHLTSQFVKVVITTVIIIGYNLALEPSAH
ncbi:hypothetical protein T4E_9970 [Trichinella pseudospiralis]|uniref:Uncharacterized protein n=1 Tax=Trichinella pseudospiralis TaxID=6337 RepID=A0A0V0XI65_TRIPS|nr:hypothetical protein T4E_9970 [Trichinella pseudospiralis]